MGKAYMDYISGEMVYDGMTIKERIIEILDKQNKKGMETYGQTLDDCHDLAYDWKIMMVEELVDALQYALKDNAKLTKENVNLRMENEANKLEVLRLRRELNK